MLNNEQFEYIVSKIKELVSIADRTGELPELLRRLNIRLPEENKTECKVSDEYLSNPNGKVLIIGNYACKVNHLIGMIKELCGIDQREIISRFEFVNGYEELKRFNFNRLNKLDYAAILGGPIPHSTKGKGEDSSIIVNLEKNETGNYPPFYRLIPKSLEQNLKITKDNVREVLSKLIEEKILIIR